MGYRSDVRIIFYSTKEKMDAFIVRCKMEGLYERFTKSSGLDLDEMWVKVCKKTYRAWDFRNDYIKWYKEYAEVQAMETMMHVADEMDIMWEFMRVGEDTDDLEIKTTENDHECILSLRREICASYSTVDNPETEEKETENG